MEKSLLWNGLVCAIIVMFASITFMPITGSLSMEKQVIQESLPFVCSTGGVSGISLITIKVAGERGLNDWYVSDVCFNFTNESDDIAEIKYQIDGGPEQTYNEPFYLNEDGEDIWLEWWALDHEGNYSDVDGPFICSIDQTEPDIIDFYYEFMGGNPEYGWDFLFTVTATDDTKQAFDSAGRNAENLVKGVQLGVPGVTPTAAAAAAPKAMERSFNKMISLLQSIKKNTDSNSKKDFH